jgi:predicted ester cyclase
MDGYRKQECSMSNAKSNLHILAEYSNKMDAGDFDAVYEYWSDDFMSHVTERVSPEMVGKDIRHKEREFWETARAAFPDMSFNVDLVLETGDFVVSNWTLKGTHTGAAFFDVPPSGKPVHINGTAILRFKDGKVVEHWGGPHCMKGIGLV